MNFSGQKFTLSRLFFVCVLLVTTVAMLSVQLSAVEPAIPESGIVNSAPILKPDFYNFAIEYTYQDTMGYIHHSMQGRLLEVIDTPYFSNDGPSTFWGDEIASQVITVTFIGRWRFLANSVDVDDEDAVGVADEERIASCTLSFALTKDGSQWRFFSGTLPGAGIMPGESLQVKPGLYGICLGAGSDIGPEPGLINKLTYDYRHTNSGPPPITQAYSQALTTSERVSDYPDFMLIAGYEIYHRLADLEPGHKIFGAVISLESGTNAEPEGE